MARLKGRSGPVWALRKLNRDVLRRFDKDIERHEAAGFENEVICKNVKLAILSASERVAPRDNPTPIRAELRRVLTEYHNLYSKWNEVGGRDPQKVNRRKQLRQALLDQIEEFEQLVEKSKHLVHGDLRTSDVDQMIFAFGALGDQHPSNFSVLRAGVGRYRTFRKIA
jgi:hypothetical protein